MSKSTKKNRLENLAEEQAFEYQRWLGMHDGVDDNHVAARRMGYQEGFREGYKNAQGEIYPIVSRLCEAVLFEWDNVADVARETAVKIEEWKDNEK